MTAKLHRSYALKAQVYTGKEGGVPEKIQGTTVKVDLTSELRDQSVTCDNFFTSYNLGQLLLKRKLSMLQTIQKNKPVLPQQINNKEVRSKKKFINAIKNIF